MDLSDIDKHVRKPAPKSTMSQIWEQLTDDQRATLEAACGLDWKTEPRPAAAVARWLTSLGLTRKVSGAMVRYWRDARG